MSDLETSGAILTVDLAAVVENYRRLSARVTPTAVAAVVKANAYGLGAKQIAPVLAQEGCQSFFVATTDEGLALRRWLPDADIHVFNGAAASEEEAFAQHRLIPVLNSLDDVARWSAYRKRSGSSAPADLHIDTGMTRLGLTSEDVNALASDPRRLSDTELDLVLSHLACADEPNHKMNERQRSSFADALARISGRRASLVNSSGIFLSNSYHYDLARAGVALYGVNPTPTQDNPMMPVVRLQARILQIRNASEGTPVGYSAAYIVKRPTRIATVAIGYADGYPHAGSGRAVAYIGEHAAPVLGRISMDLTALDVSAVPEDQLEPGLLVDMIGPSNPVDAVGEATGTIGYEVLTRLGARLYRSYLG